MLWEGLNPPFLTLEMEEGSQAVWAASRGWKNEETDEVAFGEVEVEYYPVSHKSQNKSPIPAGRPTERPEIASRMGKEQQKDKATLNL